MKVSLTKVFPVYLIFRPTKKWVRWFLSSATTVEEDVNYLNIENSEALPRTTYKHFSFTSSLIWTETGHMQFPVSIHPSRHLLFQFQLQPLPSEPSWFSETNFEFDHESRTQEGQQRQLQDKPRKQTQH
nr:hypothetical protein Iba_chr04aCG0500 [Ipomoea batatas]GMD83383.1 hypothetical protein Iba_scaffold1585767CG0010 [Ipomoea batatas]